MFSAVRSQSFEVFSLHERQTVSLHWYVSAEVLTISLKCLPFAKFLVGSFTDNLSFKIHSSVRLIFSHCFSFFCTARRHTSDISIIVMFQYMTYPHCDSVMSYLKLHNQTIEVIIQPFIVVNGPEQYRLGLSNSPHWLLCWKPNEMASNVVPVETGDGKRSSRTVNQYKAIIGLGKGGFL